MHLEFAFPRPSAAAFITLFYLYRSEEPVIEGIERADVGQIRFMLRGHGTFRFPDGSVGASTPIMLNGPGTGAAPYRVDGPFHCFGVALRPAGWGALIGLPAHHSADRVIDGATVFGGEGLALLDHLRACTTIEAMAAAAEPFLLAHARTLPPEHLRLCEAVRTWLADGEVLRVAALFERVPMSSRQIVRLTNQYFGAPPKFLERKFRALRAASALADGASPHSVAEAFYDQSHMNREIRHFTGHTPGTLAARMDPVLAATLSPDAFNELLPPPQG